MIFGYCRISTAKQNIERQERNILNEYPNAKISKEIYTGTKFYGRKEFDKLLSLVREDDTIVFDSVSRMSRDADEGFTLYEKLYSMSINLVFLKEPHINTATYRQALNACVPMTGTAVDSILQGVNQYLMLLAKEQIRLAFGQSQKEVDDLRQRTKEGMETARRTGKQIGQVRGAKLETKKSVNAKKIILKQSKDYGGNLSDYELRKLADISRNTLYKYKRELRADMTGQIEGQMDIIDILGKK